MLRGNGYDWEIDYWALGGIAYEMIFTDLPFCHKVKGEEAIFKAIKEADLSFPENADTICTKEGKDFIRAVSLLPDHHIFSTSWHP
jgi:serine/threonine protein kinase